MTQNLILIYFIIGITYTIINGAFRKLDTDGDYLLPLSWILIWPLFILALIIDRTIKLFKK
jgi:hypothetical protein